ncbi:MAG: sn-glycerol-3-phosphate ABC transporter ATP-binding protein UgpC [Anaerococcus sp.]|nr:sn-glycerol-3-phosphate ABC transporter ATP-binding protein UgpC [Anaerococcus sp.]
MANLKLEHIDKIYPNGVQAVFDFNLDIKDKEFIVFVGPSGCGKSTTLRMIAGLEEISDGSLYIDGELMNEVSPKDRNIAMVFQNYALYPHMTVFDNMAFGLKLSKVDKKEIEKKVQRAAQMLQLEKLLDRKPAALSGGQRQRVALGRAIVREADIFLMDEPLSNLDAKLRVAMRTEISKIHDQLDTTTIYVTHDQTEAMSMATRIVVMKDGYIQQVGSPEEIYDRPANVFVANFIGSPPMNFFNGKLKDSIISFGSDTIPVRDEDKDLMRAYEGKDIIVGIRPESFTVNRGEKLDTSIEAVIENIEMLGDESILYADAKEAASQIAVKVQGKFKGLNKNDKIYLDVNLDEVHLFDKESQMRIV